MGSEGILMTDWTKLELTLPYVEVLDDIKARDVDLARQFNPNTTTLANLPESTIRWNPSNRRWEIKAGTGWNPLVSRFNMDVELLDGQSGSYYLNWNNFTNKPATFPPSSHNHDDRYYTEAESDGRYGRDLANSGTALQLLNNAGQVLNSVTVAYSSRAGSADDVDGGTF